MKFSLWTQYGALNSKPIFDAFRKGCHYLGFDTVDNGSADVDVIWSVLFAGRMAGNRAIWERNSATLKPTIVLEVGGIRRGTTWKVGLNGINRDGYFGPMGNTNDRAISLNLKIKPWRTNGEYILLCGQHDRSLQWQGMPSMSQWISHMVTELRNRTQRPILIRPHPRCPINNIGQHKNVQVMKPQKILGSYDDYDMNFKNIWATISYSSNPGIHSVIEGVPAFVGPQSLAYDAANDIDFLHDIENPYMPDRTQWLNDYAWTEFTVQEIAQGVPLKLLTDKLI